MSNLVMDNLMWYKIFIVKFQMYTCAAGDGSFIDLRSAQVYCVAIFWHGDTRPILPFLFFFNSTLYSCIIIVIFYLMYLIH